jgi:hypothetical protein
MLMLAVILSTGLSFSRYTTTISNTGDSSSVVIVKDYNLDASWGTHPTDVQYPGISNQTYNFAVQNTKTNSLYYTVKISLKWDDLTPVIGLNVPLNMNLYIVNADNSLTLVPTTTLMTMMGGMEINNLYSQKATIAGSQTINLRLVWNWGTTTEDRNYNFANKNINIGVEVQAEQ